jgi:hypothetical protein
VASATASISSELTNSAKVLMVSSNSRFGSLSIAFWIAV